MEKDHPMDKPAANNSQLVSNNFGGNFYRKARGSSSNPQNQSSPQHRGGFAQARAQQVNPREKAPMKHSQFSQSTEALMLTPEEQIFVSYAEEHSSYPYHRTHDRKQDRVWKYVNMIEWYGSTHHLIWLTS